MHNENSFDYDFEAEAASGELNPHCVAVYRLYTYHRLNRILKESYGCKLKEIWQGYKANRRAGYKQLYQIVTIDESQVICDCTTLDRLRAVFAQMDYPLYDKKSATTKK